MSAFLLIAGLCAWLACPTAHWLDAAGLSVASAALGIGHPPGQVPHTLAGALFQALPVGDLAFRTTLASAAFTAAAFWPARRLARLFAGGADPPRHIPRLLADLLLAAAALSPLVVLQAVRTEVYALSTFLCLSAIALAHDPAQDRRQMHLAAFCFGLALANHPLIALFVLPFLLKRKGAGAPAWIALAGLSLLYLPLRAAARPAFNFGDPATAERWLWFLRGRLYKAYDGSSLGQLAANLAEIVELFLSSLTAAGAGLALAGMALLWLRGKRGSCWRIAAAAAWSALSLATMRNFWPENPDVGGYLSPLLWLGGVLAAAAGAVLLQAFPRGWVPALLAAAAPIWSIVRVNQAWDLGLRNDWSAHEHSRRLLSEPSPRARLYAASFSTLTLVRYAQLAQSLRPDLEAAYRGLAPPVELERHGKDDNVWWELAIYRGRSGRYTLRPEDLAFSGRLEPQNWFCRLDGPRNGRLALDLRARAEALLGRTESELLFIREPLLLNYLTQIVLARSQERFELARALESDARRLFPGFGEFEALEELP